MATHYSLKSLILAALLMGATSAKAQYRSAPFIEAEAATFVSNGSGTTLGANVGYVWSINRKLGLGLGAGVVESTDFNSIPGTSLFVRGRYSFDTSAKITPFVMMDAGATLFIDNDAQMGAIGIPINPMVGVNFGSLYVAAGYRAYILSDASDMPGCLNLKVGWNIGGRR